ncbi:hypothetical protein C8R43DRAFT_948743 [Mycena crocata]|nr:hypothetical protein C8R43DRAFT_948743 [Mycena crocata]
MYRDPDPREDCGKAVPDNGKQQSTAAETVTGTGRHSDIPAFVLLASWNRAAQVSSYITAPNTRRLALQNVNVMGQASSLARQGPYADQDPRSTEVNKEVDGWPGVPMEDLEDVSDMEEYSSRRVEPNYIWHVMRREGKLKKSEINQNA